MRCSDMLTKKPSKVEVLEVGNVYKGVQEMRWSWALDVGLTSPSAPTSGVGAIDQFGIQPINRYDPTSHQRSTHVLT